MAIHLSSLQFSAEKFGGIQIMLIFPFLHSTKLLYFSGYLFTIMRSTNFLKFSKFSNAHLGLALCCCSSSRHRLTAEPLLSNSPRCFGKANRHHHHQIGHHYPLRPKKTNFPKLAQNNVKFFLLPSTTRYQCVLP